MGNIPYFPDIRPIFCKSCFRFTYNYITHKIIFTLKLDMDSAVS